ncbi:hypothetical protein [Nostoc sp. TCL240-02]|uniref:hypothetical protein n=1 Tax=Nostoc sp. TCL240-02 TaxID=2572090 RepID=UPI00157F8D14|nr:hypothetical protein [Nostoc sp. TCL240-02]QKQ75831.1 hypothetical protein FBB35_23335 [Nostoc sp. TCL240-02]
MSTYYPVKENLAAQQQPIVQSLDVLNQSNNTEQLLDIAENITAALSKSDTVELVQAGGQTAENIFKVLVQYGGKPVAIILATAVLIAATAIPILAVKVSLGQITQIPNISQTK